MPTIHVRRKCGGYDTCSRPRGKISSLDGYHEKKQDEAGEINARKLLVGLGFLTDFFLESQQWLQHAREAGFSTHANVPIARRAGTKTWTSAS